MSESRTRRPSAGTGEPIFDKVVGDGLRDRMKQLVGNLELPREVLNYMMKQVDETKSAAVGIIAREFRLFLEKADLAEEITRVLTRISLEVTTTVKFRENDADNGGLRIRITRDTAQEPADADAPESSETPDTPTAP